MADHCVIDLNHPPRFRCTCCGLEEELELPMPVILVAQMGERFRRDHRQCQERAA